jgi:hypothetical protein
MGLPMAGLEARDIEASTRLLILIALLGSVKPSSRPSFRISRLALNSYNRLVNASSESEGIAFTW